MRETIFRRGARKLVSVAASMAVAAALAPGFTASALADSYATDTDKYVTCASYRAAEPAPEILGLCNVASNNAWGTLGALDWSSPYYYFFGTSEYNSNPNPLMVNAVEGAKLGSPSKYSPTMVVDDTRSGGPTASLEEYPTDSSDDGSKKVWDQLPDVVLGNSEGVNYNSENYALRAGSKAGKSDYKTYGAGDAGNTGNYGVVYDMTDIYTMIDTMYNLATAANSAAAGTGKELRYGDPTAIAADFEAYVKGTQGYILKKLGSKAKKKVCLVASYDSKTDTFSLSKTGVSEGTSSANRYLEAVQNVAENIADSMSLDEGSEYVTATRKQVQACDLIMVGSQTGSEKISSTEEIVSALSSAAQDKAYWTSSDNGSAGSCYGVVMNSVENAQNTGRILGCLYPEYVDQSDWIAYYYQHFYHLNTGKLDDAVDKAMDGVRNYNAKGSSQTATSWSTSDVADYDEASVSETLAEGMDYLTSLGKDAGLLTPTDEYADNAPSNTKVSIKSAKVTLAKSAVTYTGKAQTPAVTSVTLNGKTLAAGIDYTVSYSSNTNAGTAKVTVRGTRSTYTGAATTTFTIAKASQKLAVKTAVKAVKAAKAKKRAQTVKAITKVTGAKGKLSYKKAGGAAKLSVNAKTGKVTVKKGTKKGTYKAKVKVTAAASANYQTASKTVTVKVKVK